MFARSKKLYEVGHCSATANKLVRRVFCNDDFKSMTVTSQFF